MTSNELDCQDLVEIVTDYLEGDLSAAERGRFEAHLAQCPGCVTYLDQMRATIELTGRLTEESIPERARDELILAFRDWNRAGAR